MQNFEKQKVVTRFAPSPTGFMHVGNVHGPIRMAMDTQNGGIFILRIEDTDKSGKSKVLSTTSNAHSGGLGLPGIRVQILVAPCALHSVERMNKLHIYEQYGRRLIKDGFAYSDATTRGTT